MDTCTAVHINASTSAQWWTRRNCTAAFHPSFKPSKPTDCVRRAVLHRPLTAWHEGEPANSRAHVFQDTAVHRGKNWCERLMTLGSVNTTLLARKSS